VIDWTGVFRRLVGRYKRRRSRETGSEGGPVLPASVLAFLGVLVSIVVSMASPVLGLVCACMCAYACRGWNQERLQRRLVRLGYVSVPSEPERPSDEPTEPDDEPTGVYTLSVYHGVNGPTVTLCAATGIVSCEVFDSWADASEYVTELEAHFNETGRRYRFVSEQI